MPGSGDLAQDEEGTIGIDLDRDRRVADVATAQLCGDLTCESGRRVAARRHAADQRHGDRAARIYRVSVGETFLAVDNDAELVAGVEMIGGIMSDGSGLGIGDRDRRDQAYAARQCKRSEKTENSGAHAAHSENPRKYRPRLTAFMVNKK